MESNDPMETFSKTVSVLIQQTRIIETCLPDDLRPQLQSELLDFSLVVDRWEQMPISGFVTFADVIELIESLVRVQRKCVDLLSICAERVPSFEKRRIDEIQESIRHLENLPRLLETEFHRHRS